MLESSFNDSENLPASNDEIDKAIGNLFIRSGMSFRIADSPGWINMIEKINPNYAKHTPSAKVLSGRLLDQQFTDIRSNIQEILRNSENLTLTSDGWTNLRKEHLVNFVVKAPGNLPMFFKSIDTSGVPQTGDAVADAICDVIDEIGSLKIHAVVTDNAPTMQSAWKVIEKRYPWIQAYGCAAHGMNLVIKDILSIPEYSKTSKNASKIIQFVSNHHLVNFLFEKKCGEANVTRKLQSSVPTRWYSHFTSTKTVLDAKIALKRLANEDFAVLSKIEPKEKSIKVLEILKTEDFWERITVLHDLLEYPSKAIGKS
jgi:hypothetical protein